MAIGTLTALVAFMPGGEEVRTVASYLAENGYKDLMGSFPSFHIPQLDKSIVEVLQIIAPTAFILAVIGLTESLMTLTLIDEITETRGKGNKEAVGQ